MPHLDGLHARPPGRWAARTVMENHLQVLLLVLKQNVRTAARQLEILAIEGHDVPGGAARAHTWTGRTEEGGDISQTPQVQRGSKRHQVAHQYTELRAERAL